VPVLFGSTNGGSTVIHGRSAYTIVAKMAWLAAALALNAGAATGGEANRYPDLRGQWTGVLRTATGMKGQPSFDPSKSWGKYQDAPLTPEYQAILETSIKE
jgi:hypothetical protein